MVKLIAACAVVVVLGAVSVYGVATTLQARDDARALSSIRADVLDARLFNSKRDSKHVEAAFAHSGSTELAQDVIWLHSQTPGAMLYDDVLMGMLGSLYGETTAEMKKQGWEKHREVCRMVFAKDGSWNAGYCVYEPVAEG
jgi:hypothetical protein